VSLAESTASEATVIARAFTEARRTARAVTTYPGTVPDTLEAAYRIQDEAIALWPDRIAGWKLGRIGAPDDQRFGAGRLAGPIFSRSIWPAGTETVRFGVIDKGFAAVEAEYILELGVTAPSRDDWTATSVIPLVANAFVGVEIAGSPFAGINLHGPAVTASDFGNNAGLILGGAIMDWRRRLPDLTCQMQIDDVLVGSGGARAIPNGPFDSLAFLLNTLHRRGRGLEAGQLISTGAATGVHSISAGSRAVADFGPDGHIACLAVKAEGIQP
jgi:2-keto-4-pentenoate hydratase